MSPPLALTMGDPAGIGPEIALAAWSQTNRPLLAIGDLALWSRLAAPLGIPVRAVSAPQDVSPEAFCVLDVPLARPVTAGKPDGAHAAATIRFIETAVHLTQSGAASGVVTGPISKDVLISGADFAYPGHTEFLAALDGAKRPVMMLAGPQLRVVPVTIHIALSEVPAQLTTELLRETIEITAAGLTRDFGIANPRLAVAGLNPHAGENGRMGGEEIALITPLLDKMRAEGHHLSGPHSADTMFHPEARATYDAAICMYHDQALIPLKTLSFSDGVNVTLGLSFVRTSPDHGTAFDIAGQGIADPRSLIAAIEMASDMAEARS